MKKSNKENLIDIPQSFLRTDEGRSFSNGLGKGIYTVFSISSGMSDPTGTVAESVGAFSEVAAPLVVDASEKMMQTAHVMSDTEGDRFMRSHPMRDSNGRPITIEEGAKLAFGGGQKSKTLATQKGKKETKGVEGKETKSKTLSKQKADSQSSVSNNKKRKIKKQGLINNEVYIC